MLAPLPVLLEILDDMAEDGLGGPVLRVLRRRRDPELLREMVARVGSSSWFIRDVSCAVLGELKDRRATPVLLIALHDRELMVRRTAAFALAFIKDPESEAEVRRTYAGARTDNINFRMALECALDELGATYERHP